MPGASAGGGYAANAGQFGSIGTGTAAGSAAASGYGGTAGGINPLYLLMGVQSLGTAATSYYQSQSQRAEGNFQSSIYASNARIQEIMAKDAIRRGEASAIKAKQAARRLIGSQRAAMGAQGIDLESGSALDIQEETAALGAEDALNIRNNAWREAWGYRVAATDYTGRAKYARITGAGTSRNTILTGGLSIAKSFAYASYLDKNRSALTLEDYLSGGA